MWSVPAFAALLGGVARPYLALAVGVAVLVTIRHKENIRRLVRGEEKKA
jgi:glycerol-3-phosphate acyltransferase PlsY